MPKGSTPQHHGRRNWLPRLTRPVACFFFLLSTAAFGCGDDVSGDPGGQPPPSGPQCPAWDTDCDDISNAVESNSANSHHFLSLTVKNTNNSRAHGPTGSGGWLESGFNLPDQGTGYFHYRGTDPPDYDDWGVLHLINLFEASGRTWNKKATNCGQWGSTWCSRRLQYGVGDTSLRNGGQFPPHATHRNGLDGDLRYHRRNTTSDEGTADVCTTDQHDLASTLDLVNILISEFAYNKQTGKVVQLIINQCVGITDGNPNDHFVITKAATDHKDHFHIRIEDPDGTSN